jgi:polar amino acid transport system substrate-binding protein
MLINFDEAHPPYMCNKGGEALGIYPALIQAAFARMNVEVRLEPKPWARAILELENGSAGVGGIYKNSERLKKYDYSEPLLVETITVYFHRDRPLAYAQIGDLFGKRVGVMRGWSYGDAFDQARAGGLIQVESVSSDDQNFLKLQSGRIDALLAIDESVSSLLTAHPDIRASGTPFSEAPAFLAFSKGSNLAPLLRRFDQVIREMKASGEFRRLVQTELAR